MHCSSPSSTTASENGGSLLRTTGLIAAVLCVALHGGVVAQAGDAPAFTDASKDTGLRFRHNFGAKRLENVLMTTGSGCALLDFDNDGWLDAFLVNGTYLDDQLRPAKDRGTHHALFRNRGNGTFENVTRAAGFVEATYGQGVACADFDGDGHVDIYITNYGPNRLFRNKGDGTFEDVTARSGTGDPRWGGGAVFFDQDGDGDLDLFVANYVKFRPGSKGVHASALSKRTGFRFFPGPRDYEAEEDVMYRNNGDGTFTDVSAKVGLASGGKGLTTIAGDFDGDGDQDLFVANDATPNFFYRNDGGKFTDIALEAGVAYDPDGVETAAMGVDAADVDGDGRCDLYVTNMVFEFNNMYVNQGKLVFKDRTRSLGLDKDNYRHVGWATRFADFNHDGHLDCFVANGHVVDYVDGFSQSITYGQQNMMFLGEGKGRFKEVGDDCGKCFRRKRVSRGGAFGDIDNDGDLDILISNSGSRAELLRNDLPKGDRWIKVRLRGRAPNTQALGAKVVASIGSRSVRAEIRCAPSYLSSSDPTLHLGLPPGVSSSVIEVTWPQGGTTRTNVKAGTLAVISAPKDSGNGK